MLCLVVLGCSASVVEEEADLGLPPEVERYIHARCSELLECDCESESYVDHDSCADGLAAIYRSTAAVRTVNLACFDAAATQWRTGGCDGSTDEQCAPFENVRSEGQSCVPFGFRDYHLDQEDCADGLTCSDGTCVVFDPLEAGDPCTGSGACGIQLVCREGLCLPPGALGDSCFEERTCDPHLNCVENVCVEASNEGEPCSVVTDCSQPLQCVFGRCIQIHDTVCYAAAF